MTHIKKNCNRDFSPMLVFVLMFCRQAITSISLIIYNACRPTRVDRIALTHDRTNGAGRADEESDIKCKCWAQLLQNFPRFEIINYPM